MELQVTKVAALSSPAEPRWGRYPMPASGRELGPPAASYRYACVTFRLNVNLAPIPSRFTSILELHHI